MEIQGKFMTLAEVLASIDEEWLWKADLFIAGKYPWNPESNCFVFTGDEEDIPEVEEELKKTHNMKHIIQTVDVVMIVDYAERQVADVTMQQLVDSFNYYWRYDAPLDFDDE